MRNFCVPVEKQFSEVSSIDLDSLGVLCKGSGKEFDKFVVT